VNRKRGKRMSFYKKMLLACAYFEKEYSEENREIFNNMLATLKFGQ